MKGKTVLLLVFILTTSFSRGDIQKRGLIFPPTSLYGTFVAIAVPLDIPDRNVFVSYNFESNYSVISNITEIDEVIFPNLPIIASRHSRSITRELAYTVLETRFKENGMNGKECMLRNICEAAETPLHHNGLLGHIMHIIFTPSASREEGLDDEYYEAEADGYRGDCDKYIDLCPLSLFDLITRNGMNGKECMLRNICEAAETPLHHNGLLGHIMHIIFTPSASREEGLDDEYYEAEADGYRGDCDKYIDLCPLSLFDLITRLVEIRH